MTATCRECGRDFTLKRGSAKIVLEWEGAEREEIGAICGKDCARKYLTRDLNVTRVAIPWREAK